MCVTNDYKTITFSRSESFAVVRALRARVDELEFNHQAEKNAQRAAYLAAQLVAARTALAAVKAMPFSTLQAAA